MPINGGLEELKKVVEKVYLINDPYITEVMVAAVVAHRIAADPVWIVIVAASGAGKSEFINAISGLANVHSLSTITSNTFISGMKNSGKETSLLLKIQNGILTFKDFTTLMSEQRDERAIIMAQLREIYDGKFSKVFGTGQEVKWEGKITVIAGATYAIHTLRQTYTAMGERFIMYNMEQPPPIDAAKRAMENQESGKIKEMRATVATAFKKYDEQLEIPETLLKISDALQKDILLLAELATRARSSVERNWKSRMQEITDVHPPEMPTRFASQLQNFAKALAIITYNEANKMEVTEKQRNILYKIALDSITTNRRKALRELVKYDVIETAGLATKLGFPTTTVRIWLEDLTALGIAEREKKGGGSKGDRWKIRSDYGELIRKFEHIEEKGGELVGEKNNEEDSQNSDPYPKLPDF